MKEFIAAKTMECDYRPLAQKCAKITEEFNQLLIRNVTRPAQAM